MRHAHRTALDLFVIGALSLLVAHCSRDGSFSRPELPDGSCRPEVIAASRAGDLPALRHLLERGAKISCVGRGSNARRETPLAIAVDSRNPALLSFLISHGVDADAEFREAMSSNQIDVVRILLDAGVSANVPLRPTMPIGVVRLLLERGADANRRVYGMSARGPSFAVAPQLLGEVCWTRDLTPLIEGAQAGASEYVRALLDHGADPSLTDEEGRTALDVARLRGHQSIVAQLEPVAPAPHAIGRPRRRVHYVRPVMPPIAVAAGNRGLVIVKIAVDHDGRVAQAEIVCSRPLLDASALAAVKQWRYARADDSSTFPVAVDFTPPR